MIAKRFLASLLAMTICLVMTYAKAQTPYENTQYGFVLTPPPKWAQTSSQEALAVYIEPLPAQVSAMRPAHESNKEFLARISKSLKTPTNSQSAFRANITITAAPSPVGTIKEYARVTRAKSARMKDYRIIGEVPSLLGHMAAIRRTVRISTLNQTPIQTCEVSCLRRGRIFTITIAAPYARFARYVPIFNKVVSQFAWK